MSSRQLSRAQISKSTAKNSNKSLKQNSPNLLYIKQMFFARTVH